MKPSWRIPAGVVGFLLFGSGALAQVSCSPNVDKQMCADAATFLNPIVDHGTPYHGIGIPVEIVTPTEYAKRLANTKELEKREADYVGGLDKAAKSPDKFSPFYRHTLANAWSENITFFRDKPSSRYVSAVLISSAEFDDLKFEVDAKTNVARSVDTGKYESSRVGEAAGFIGGYLCGTMSTTWDGSITLDVLSDGEKKP
jgi:hypothetical protein